ncbi:MAG TPA: type III-B CRISPR-associated protein Cas10/Cmr2 [Ktedonobacteraceae bacterium]|nr:type III-B CRISPR-associated protein Cas10/Cmr2 [Ktedonobacteraceae bacterium]
MRYLFQISIGPVQDFIASARRTRDLSFGSWFLSELARAAAHQIVEQNGLGSLIFPAPFENAMLDPNYKEFNVANKIVALIEQPPQDLSILVRRAVSKRLHEIRGQAFKNITLPRTNQTRAEAQIDDLVEFLWVAHPYNEKDYEGMRRRLEALMAMRKNTRDFASVKWGDYIPKSSLDGQLESVIPEHEYPARRESETEKLAKIKRLYDHYGAGPAERLSGVDILKRRGTTAFGSHFLSTSHMAAASFLKRLEVLEGQSQEVVKAAWIAYIEKLQTLATTPQLERIPDSCPPHPILDRYDGSLLFEDRLVDVVYIPAADTSKSSRLQEAKKALNGFYHSLDAQFTALGLSKERPDPYYALLQADGDGMGAAITAQAEYGYEKHRQLSQALSHFAGKVDGIVRKHEGAPVYAGGDDVLAFLPLHTVLQCASELATQFRDELKGFPGQDGHTPTLSVGVSIVHHLDSLREARELAQEAERRAKRVGKNALAITVSKRSGESYSIARPWDSINGYLEQLIIYCRADAIPDGTAYELRDLALRLTVSTDGQDGDPAKQKINATLSAVIKRDALRILQRKLYVPVGKFPKEQAKAVESFLTDRLDGVQEQQANDKETALATINEFINELIIAQTLADARKLAEPKEGVQL